MSTKVYLWRIPDEYPERLVGKYLSNQSPDPFAFRRGSLASLNFPPPRIDFNATPQQLSTFDVLVNDSTIPLLSERAAQVITKNWAEDVQIIDAQVMAKGHSLSGYKLVNITHLVNCVDHHESDCVFMKNADQILKFNRLRLKLDEMGTHHLAREAEYPPFLYVSHKVKEVFDMMRWKGYSFIPPESVHP